MFLGKSVLKIYNKSTRNTHAEVWFQYFWEFSCKTAANFQRTFSQEHLWRAVSVIYTLVSSIHYTLEYLLFTMLFMYTKKTSNGKEEFSKHKTIFSHHRFHSLVCHLLGKNRKWFLLPLALISQLCKLVIASL